MLDVLVVIFVFGYFAVNIAVAWAFDRLMGARR